MIGIGVMSGSSLDGVDVALVEFNKDTQLEWKLLYSRQYALSHELKLSLASVVEQKAFEIAETQSSFTFYLHECLSNFLKVCPKPGQVDFVAIHGHTVLHSPKISYSWQLLNAGQISSMLNLSVVSDFRNQDLGLGGEGAPMAVLADRDLFKGYDYYFNLGGIANVSYFEQNEWRAYDVCPCNQVLNFFAEREGLAFDENGSLSKNGAVDQPLLNALNKEEYIISKPPKSLDNSWIKNYWLEKMHSFKLSNRDYLRTFVEFLAQQIDTIVEKKEAKVLMTGGGVKNSFLIERLIALNSNNSTFEIPEEDILEYKEAILIAYAGYLRINSLPNFISSATGSSYDTVGGALYYSKSQEDE